MINSIRKRLLILLMIAVTMVLALVAVGNYVLDKGDIERHLDILLNQAGLAVQTLAGKDIVNRNVADLQKQLNQIPQLAQRDFASPNHNKQVVYNIKFQFQIWDTLTHRLIIHSANAPVLPFAAPVNGFSWISLNGQTWRVFTSVDLQTRTQLSMAYRDTVLTELNNRIAKDDMIIALFAFPLLAILIWVVISRSLQPLQAISREVASRVPGYLEPVRVQTVPQEIRPLVNEINKLLLRLKRALEREKRFAADAAHELRTPLAALKAQVQLIIATQSQDETRAEHSQRLLRIVDRSSHIIEQLLTLSRIIPEETDSFNDFTPVDLHKITAETLALLVPHALEKSIELALEGNEEPLMLNANATMLGILIRNLVDNAIRYSPEHSHVTVSIHKTQTTAVLEVLDNGPGIPPALRSRVFERFYRVLGTNTQGTGLGLAIVQQIAALHQAIVSLGAGAEGHGLRVTITLPLHLPAKPQV